MTLSVDARKTNLTEALTAFLAALGEQAFVGFYIEREKFPNVLPTTWTELLDRRWLDDKNTNYEMYGLTRSGYVQALMISGRSDEPEFLTGLGKICRVLKDSLRGRADSGLVLLQEVMEQAHVPEAFVKNAIDADLIRHLLRRVGATWDGECTEVIRVPHNFGHVLI